MKKNFKSVRMITLEGMMTYSQLDNGLHTVDFTCCADVELEPYVAQCKVQTMRDGNVYVTEQPKRVRNRPLFRDDNCSLSLGRDGRYYFVFSLREELVTELPELLVQQASTIAQKVHEQLIINNE